MEAQENFITDDPTSPTSPSIIYEKKKYLNSMNDFNNKFSTTSNDPLRNLIEKHAKEFEEFGKRLSLELKKLYKELFSQQNIKLEKGYTEIEEKFISQSQLIESLKARIEYLENDSIIKNQEIKKLRNEFNESSSSSLTTKSLNDSNDSNDTSLIADQSNEIESCDESFNETIIGDDDSFFLHETFQNISGTTFMRCKKCEKTFKNQVRFRYHAKEKHQHNWLCLVCYLVFSSRGTRGKHMRINHTKDFPCTLCSKECYDITSLREHFRAKHPGEKCPQVSTILTQTSSTPQTPQFVTEQFIHEIIPYQFPSNKRPPYQLKCKFCDEMFSNHSLFNQHAKNFHDCNILCLYCSQVFSERKLKKKHMRNSHRYTCKVCDKKVRGEGGLISHCKAKNHQMNIDETIYSSDVKEFQFSGSISSQEENLYNNYGKNKNLEEKKLQEEDELEESDSVEDSDSFIDDDTEEENDGSDDDDDGVNFPKCEECQLYFRNIKYLEKHDMDVHACLRIIN